MSLTMDNNGNGLVMPVAPMYGGNSGGINGWGDGGWWLLLLLFALGGNWGNGGFGGGNEFPWLMSGQQNINANTNGGFRDQMINNNVTSIRDGIHELSTQISTGFAGVEQGACARQMANMQSIFDVQTAMNQGMNGLQSQLAQCCCDNRAATADLKYTIATENCADRQAVSDGIRDLLANQTANTQRILDQLCSDKIDAKNETIAQLRQELMFARGQASQDVQTAAIRAGQVAEIDALYNRLSACPVPTVPVYGSQPVYSCNNGCGCGNAAFA